MKSSLISPLKFISLATSFFILFNVQSLSAKELIFPDVYEVLKVNGDSFSRGLFESESKITLPVGRHVILYRYSELFEDADNDDHVKVKSDQFVLVVNKAEETIKVSSPRNQEEKQAREYAKSPSLTLTTSSDKKVVYQTFALADFEQRQYQSVLDTRSSNEGASAKPAMLPALPNQVGSDRTAHSRALDMLNYWWQQASEQEKAAFKQQHNL
ncbi:DUF2057 domain-containing protein [Thalassotalea euphylliae]|uniref:DUF2057 domain-containing protein n=1 Tax=Thalassotalea euphylliae TaxID=1655234 RepID=A0A3E0UFX0_9GAMM|nr:DUF2057 domain-containing protein [Thalassotalea euphylliae]REL35789.1 DUF2057 domain-containing protein [Thalassotalea euphylliae]